MTALALLKQNKKAEAGRLFAAIAADSQVPNTIRTRAVQVAGTLGVDASASHAGAAAAGLKQMKSVRTQVRGADARRAGGERMRNLQERRRPRRPCLASASPFLRRSRMSRSIRRRAALPFSLPGAGRQHRMGAGRRQRREVDGSSRARPVARPGLGRLHRRRRRASAARSLRRRRSSATDGSSRSTRRRLSAPSTRRPVQPPGLRSSATSKGNSASLFGGGVAFDNGRIYATNGLGYVAALDARNGGIVWQVHPTGPLRGSPTVVGDTLYVISAGQPDLLAQDERRLDQLVAGCGAGNRRRVRFGIAGRRSGHGRRRFLVG